MKNEEDIEFFSEENFDLMIVGGWQRLFPESVLDTLKIGAIGGHGSSDFLPKGRGRSPLNWSLIEGKKRFILQWFLIEPGIDDGKIFASADFDILPSDTIKTLYQKNSIVTKLALMENIPRLLNGSCEFKEQLGVPSYYPKRSPEDGFINWEEMDVWEIANLIRALTKPYPGAYGFLGQKQYRIWRSQVFDTRIKYPEAGYGQVVDKYGEDLIINCRGGLLLVDEYQIIGM